MFVEAYKPEQVGPAAGCLAGIRCVCPFLGQLLKLCSSVPCSGLGDHQHAGAGGARVPSS